MDLKIQKKSGYYEGACTLTPECTPSTSESCYTGLPATEDKGICVGGSRTCSSECFWGACNNQVLPQNEICGDSIDQDCDGIDEVCPTSCTSDTNGDLLVDLLDIVSMAQNWGTANGNADFDSSGNVGVEDLIVLASNFGTSC